MKKMIAMVLIVCTGAVSLVFAGANRETRKKPAELIRVVLDWTPNTNHTGLYVAQEKGYFAEEGLTVQIMQPPEDGGLILLSAGNAEFAIDFQEAMGPAIGRNRDALPVVAIAGIINHNTSGIMSLEKKGIQSPRDLEGKRFASWGTPLVTEIVRNLVEQDGGDFQQVQIIPNATTDAFSALATDVDAIWIYYAWDGVAAEVNQVDIDYLDLGKINPVFDFYTPVLVTNTNYAAANPEQVKKFLKAVSRGYTFAMENPQEAGEILLKYAPELDRNLVIHSQVYLASQYQAESKRWGEIDRNRWGRFYRWMFERGLLEKDIGDQGFTNAYLP